MIKPNHTMSFSEMYISARFRKNSFLFKINQIIDWNPIDNEIRKLYN